jgi:hypothetical protein
MDDEPPAALELCQSDGQPFRKPVREGLPTIHPETSPFGSSTHFHSLHSSMVA